MENSLFKSVPVLKHITVFLIVKEQKKKRKEKKENKFSISVFSDDMARNETPRLGLH